MRPTSWGPLYAEDDIAGRDAASAVPLRGDRLDDAIGWKNGSLIEPLEPATEEKP